MKIFLEKDIKEIHASGSIIINENLNLPQNPALSDNIISDNKIMMTSKSKIAAIKAKF